MLKYILLKLFSTNIIQDRQVSNDNILLMKYNKYWEQF